MYAMRIKQFFCSCQWSVHEGDVVVVRNPNNGNILLAQGLICHLNQLTGHACIRPINTTDVDAQKSTLNEVGNKRHVELHRIRGFSVAGNEIHNQVPMPSFLNTKHHITEKHDEHNFQLQRHASMTALSDTALLAGEHQTLKDIPFWSYQLWSINRARELQLENDDPDDDNDKLKTAYKIGCSRCCCGTQHNDDDTHSARCCCTWFNVYFVLDFIVVVAALIMENVQAIFGAFGLDVSDTSFISEAAVFLIIIRSWRILRVFHGAWEASKKVSSSMFDVKMELAMVVDQGLYEVRCGWWVVGGGGWVGGGGGCCCCFSHVVFLMLFYFQMVARKKDIENGTLTHAEFYSIFCNVFGNPADENSERACHGEGHNYIHDIEQKLKQVDKTTNIVKKMGSHHASMDDLLKLG